MTETEQSAGPEDMSSIEQRARRRLAAEKGFYIHLATYVIVIGCLFLINAITGSRWWFVWPALGWGIGILVHALVTFGLVGFMGREWERRRLNELIEEERSRR
jgi:fatty acid desaturase